MQLEQQRHYQINFKFSGNTGKKHPILSSACPGWICYAEKTHGNWILPYISKVKSAQQIMGSLVKSHLASKLGVNPSKVYHITVMPCFDKKLEASRNDFLDETTGIHDVDLVITTVEVEQMLDESSISLPDLTTAPIDQLQSILKPGNPSDLLLKIQHGSGSGGFTENIFRMAAKELFNEDFNEKLEYKTMKNADFQEVNLINKSGEVQLSFAVANGFRNIQNLVQKLKRKRCNYDFVEVMACPSGCLNGGAQCRPEGAGVDAGNILAQKETVNAVGAKYRAVQQQKPGENPSVPLVYDDWLGGKDTDKAKHFLYTQYHEVEKMTNSLAIKW